jgi:hypothetical protein
MDEVTSIVFKAFVGRRDAYASERAMNLGVGDAVNLTNMASGASVKRSL